MLKYKERFYLFKKYLHEPLIHFTLIGALIFAFYYWDNSDISLDKEAIVLTQVEIIQLTNRWQKKHLRLPSAKEKQEFIDKAIYTKVMYTEALKMGLDKNDLIIRRRLAQKMEFVSSDMAELVEPTDKELLGYLQKHATQFMDSEKISFLQIYIEPNKHQGSLEKDLEKILKLLHASDENSTLDKYVDAFIFPIQNSNLSKQEVAQDYGKAFTQTLFSLETNRWHKGIKSAYGLHFIYIQKRVEGELLELEKIRTILYNEWMTEKKEKNNILLYENLKNSYIIKIEESIK